MVMYVLTKTKIQNINIHWHYDGVINIYKLSYYIHLHNDLK
jgi:hypothetical protein